MSASDFLQYLMTGLYQGSVYALVGLGFTMIYAVTNIINFAQGEFVMLGAMLSFTLCKSAGLPVPLAAVLSVAATAIIGIIMYLSAIRTAKKASVVSLIIVTIGLSILIRGVASEIWGENAVRPPAFSGGGSISIGGAYISPQALWIIGTTIVVTILLHLFLKYTMIGKALKACSINPAAAGLVGISAKSMALLAFAIAAALGGIGGVVLSPAYPLAYDDGVDLALRGFIAASIGGFQSPIITVVGGITLGIVESIAIGVDWGPFSSAYKDVIALLVLLVILLVRSGKLASEERAG